MEKGKIQTTTSHVPVSDSGRYVAEQSWELSRVDSQQLIESLYHRGVSIRDIFGRYYEIEEASNGRALTVEDARLAYGEGGSHAKEF